MSETQSWTERHPGATYTGARLAIFAGLFVLLLLIIRNVFIALITAAILSSIISVFALRKQRDALSLAIATRAERANQRMAERAASEDSWDEEQRLAAESEAEPQPEPQPEGKTRPEAGSPSAEGSDSHRL